MYVSKNIYHRVTCAKLSSVDPLPDEFHQNVDNNDIIVEKNFNIIQVCPEVCTLHLSQKLRIFGTEEGVEIIELSFGNTQYAHRTAIETQI